MNYIFVNKMHLIPKIVTFDKNELHLALQLLKKEGNNKNVYIVKTYKTLNLSIIFYKNNSFYRINDDSDNIENFTYVNDIDFIQQFKNDRISLIDSDMIQLNEQLNNHNSVLIDVHGHGTTDEEGMIESGNGDGGCMSNKEGVIEYEIRNGGCAIETKCTDEIKEGSKDEEKTIIKNKLKEECEKVMELYAIQKDRVNKLNRDVLMIEKRETKLIQDIYDKKFNLLNNLHTDLKVYEQLQEQNVQDLPILFCKKYEYFKNAKEDDDKIYERIKTIDINKLLDEGINEETVNKYNLNELFTISNKYNNDLKKLNVIFEHSWSELEEDLGN
jgi:hypothetical protein